jgi:hypothetical protein
MGKLILIKASTEPHMVLDIIYSLMQTVWEELFGEFWLTAMVDRQLWRHPAKHPLIFILLCTSRQESMFNSLWHDGLCEGNLFCLFFFENRVTHCAFSLGYDMCSVYTIFGCVFFSWHMFSLCRSFSFFTHP